MSFPLLNQTCVCSCGEVFLNMDAKEYLKHHKFVDPKKAEKLEMLGAGLAQPSEFSIDDIQKYDKWVNKATLHWIENPHHTITVSGPKQYTLKTKRDYYDMTAPFKVAYSMLGKMFLDGLKKTCEFAWDEGAVI